MKCALLPLLASSGEKITSEPLLYSWCLPASVCESAVQQPKHGNYVLFSTSWLLRREEKRRHWIFTRIKQEFGRCFRWLWQRNDLEKRSRGAEWVQKSETTILPKLWKGVTGRSNRIVPKFLSNQCTFGPNLVGPPCTTDVGSLFRTSSCISLHIWYGISSFN